MYMPKRCSFGHENPDGSAFCGKCGEPLSDRAHFRATFCPLWPVNSPVCRNFCITSCGESGATLDRVAAPGEQFERAAQLAWKCYRSHYPDRQKFWDETVAAVTAKIAALKAADDKAAAPDAPAAREPISPSPEASNQTSEDSSSSGEVGQHNMLVPTGTATPVVNPEPDAMAIEPGGTSAPTRTIELDAGTAVPATLRARLIVVSDNHVFDLPDKDNVFIGRADPILNTYPDIDLGRYGNTINRRHARIFIEKGRYMLENVGANIGVVRLNDQHVPVPAELHDNDEIRLSGVLLRFKTL